MTMDTTGTTHDTFWARVDALLDERRDPFDDPAVADALLRDPALLEPLERLVDRLGRVEGLARGRPMDGAEITRSTHRRSRVAAWVAGAAAVALVVVLASRSGNVDSGGTARPDAVPRDTLVADAARGDPGAVAPATSDVAPARPRARIHSFSSTVRHERCDPPVAATPGDPLLVSWRQTWTSR